jgi:hypothetical protein
MSSTNTYYKGLLAQDVIGNEAYGNFCNYSLSPESLSDIKYNKSIILQIIAKRIVCAEQLNLNLGTNKVLTIALYIICGDFELAKKTLDSCFDPKQRIEKVNDILVDVRANLHLPSGLGISRDYIQFQIDFGITLDCLFWGVEGISSVFDLESLLSEHVSKKEISFIQYLSVLPARGFKDLQLTQECVRIFNKTIYKSTNLMNIVKKLRIQEYRHLAALNPKYYNIGDVYLSRNTVQKMSILEVENHLSRISPNSTEDCIPTMLRWWYNEGMITKKMIQENYVVLQKFSPPDMFLLALTGLLSRDKEGFTIKEVLDILNNISGSGQISDVPTSSPHTHHNLMYQEEI